MTADNTPSAGQGRKRWPFVESPGEFTARLASAFNDFGGDMLAAVRNVLIENPPALSTAPDTAPVEAGGGVHPDDLAVDRFAAAMKAKLAKKRAEGRGGWEDKNDCSNEFLSQLLREHIDKGDPVDVGNLAMMIHQRGERVTPPPAPLTPSGASVEAVREGALGWNSPEEWEIEQRAFHAAGRDDVPKDVQELVAILWKQYCIAAEPLASLTPAPTQGDGA